MVAYSGGKFRQRKVIVECINKFITSDQNYYEPFLGGCNIAPYLKEKNHKILSDINPYIIAMYKETMKENYPYKKYFTPEEYKKIKENPDAYPDHVVGFRGVVTFGSIWMGKLPINKRNEDYCGESIRSLKRIQTNLKNYEFLSCSYSELNIKENSFIYCDPPYINTNQGYIEKNFNHEQFYNWIYEMKTIKHCTLLISEGYFPENLGLKIHEFNTKSSLSQNKKYKKFENNLYLVR